jgi:hypothetical protein
MANDIFQLKYVRPQTLKLVIQPEGHEKISIFDDFKGFSLLCRTEVFLTFPSETIVFIILNVA